MKLFPKNGVDFSSSIRYTVSKKCFKEERTMKTFKPLAYGSEPYKLFLNQANKLEPQIVLSEFEAIMQYTSWGYQHYYGFLENVNVDGTTFGSQYDEDTQTKLINALTKGVNLIDSVIAKNGFTDVPVNVFRAEKAFNVDNLEMFLKETYSVDETVTFKRFLSTSMNPQIASELINDDETYMLVISASEGAYLGGSISEQGLREKEVLLPRNRSYKVTSVGKSVVKNGSSSKEVPTVFLTLLP